MKISFLILIQLFLFQNIFSQCDCEKITRTEGTITQCKTLPIGGDRNLQLGVSLLSNGQNKYIALTIRYLSGPALKVNGNLSIRLINNNLQTFSLVNTQSSFIGNSEVENAIFLISETQLILLQNSNLLTISFNLTDNRLHTIEVSLNKDVLKNQSKCL